ncbi:hypothetical protein [Haliscomenobacter sp.]|uniref:hypothetical protein n=1 Tax=Haliscomenobacter sp. TaxID=2717303 RepID=UPI003BAABC79
MNLCKEEFKIENHKHKFAVWAAGRAASVLGQRFKVELAKELIDGIELKRYIDYPGSLPDNFDEEHNAWCEKLIAQSDKKISYGVAAKLINVYLKTIFVCGGYHEHEKVKKIHPPIDRLLFKGLALCNVGELKDFWKQHLDKGNGWSQFDKSTYIKVIEKIKECTASDSGLYTIEHFWVGHQ